MKAAAMTSHLEASGEACAREAKTASLDAVEPWEALFLAAMPVLALLETLTLRRPLKYALFATVALAVVGLPRVGRVHALAAMARAFAAVPLVVFVFDAVLTYIPALVSRRADSLLMELDRAIFGVDPTVWAAQFAHPVLTEWLQISYAAFYLVPIAVGGTLYLAGRQRDHQTATFALVYTFFLNFVAYFALPAIGPRFTMHDPASASVELPGLLLTEPIREALFAATGRSYDCFPSGHTDVTLCSLGLAWRFERRLFAVLLPVAASVFVATIYLRYHYVVDLAAGAVVAAFALLTAGAVQRRIEAALA